MGDSRNGRVPSWVRDGVFYGIVPDRFAVGGGIEYCGGAPEAFEAWDALPVWHAFKGGNLRGIAERLPYLADLGVTALYLTPIFCSPNYHRYKTIDFFQVDPLLGGNAAFDALLAAAHAREIRIVLDGVFNHVGLGFQPFLNVLEYGEASPWKDWFVIEGWPLNPFDHARPANYRYWTKHRNMPELNHANPAVQDFILRVAEHWVRRGIDGWRFDCPEKVGGAPFWRELRARLKRVNPDVYLLGEIWTDASRWLDGTQWDGVTNYPLMGIVRQFVGGARILPEHLLAGQPVEPPVYAAEFARRLEALLALYPWDVQLTLYNFIDTADVARFRTLTGGDAAGVALATLLVFTLPGAPCILYGDEVGLPGGRDPDCRRGFPAPERWDRGCLAYHKALVALRRSRAALRGGAYRALLAEGLVFAFERALEAERLIVVVNAGEEAASVALPMGPAGGRAWTRLYGAGTLERRDDEETAVISLPARAGAVFEG